MTAVSIVDYGVGNTASVKRAFERLGATVELTGDPGRVAAARRLVLPGVGAFAPARERLRASGLEEALKSSLAKGARILGLCLGFQLLFEESDEFGVTKGLALLPGRVAPFAAGVRVPHVGWNELKIPQVGRSRLLAGVPAGSFVYFVHSFRVEGARREDVAAACDHGGDFPAAVERGNVQGCQFHPEKSSVVGQRILSNFLQGDVA